MSPQDAAKLVDDFEDGVLALTLEVEAGTEAEQSAEAEYARIRAELIRLLVSAP